MAQMCRGVVGIMRGALLVPTIGVRHSRSVGAVSGETGYGRTSAGNQPQSRGTLATDS